jgi:hypothetical protein
MPAMSKRDPARYAEINREKARQLILEARAAREMSRSSGPSQNAQASAAAGEARTNAER